MALFLFFGYSWLADLSSVLRAAGLFVWLFAVILWCASGVVEEADHLAELLGEPLGTLVLTLSIVIVEVVLIAAVVLGSEASSTSSSSASRVSSGRFVTWKRCAWLNQTVSPVTG